MKANMICNQLGKLEQLKLISKGKLSRCLADPLNKEKASAFEDAQEEWYKQFKVVQGTMKQFIEEEVTFMNVTNTNDVQFYPVPQSITNRVCETLKKINAVYEYEIVGQNIIKIVDDCYECQLHLDRYSYYFTDENDGGHRSMPYRVQNYYGLYKDPEELFVSYDDFTESLSAMWAVDSRFNKPFTETKPIPDLTPTPVEIVEPEPPKLSILTSKIIMEIHNSCVLNNQDVAEDNQLRAHISAGIVAGEIKLLHTLGIGGEMDTYAHNGCPHIGKVVIENFMIWENGKCNPEQLVAALDFYK